MYRALVISVKDTLFFIVRNRDTVYKCKLGTAFGLINNFVIFSEMVVGTKNKQKKPFLPKYSVSWKKNVCGSETPYNARIYGGKTEKERRGA